MSPAICSSCFLISPVVDSLWFESVFEFSSFFSSVLRLVSIWELRMKSFLVSIEVLYPLLRGPPLTLTSLLMVTSVTEFPGIVESSFPLRLAPRPKVSRPEKALGFVIDKFVNSTLC